MIEQSSRYFQKSKVFLYPLLDIKINAGFNPVNTYIAWDKKYTPAHLKLICIYNPDVTDPNEMKRFDTFEAMYLLRHRLLESKITDSGYIIYVFNYREYATEFKKFLDGKYSTMEVNIKNRLMNFFKGTGMAEYYITAYLNPDAYHKDFADEYGVPLDVIVKVHELCTPPDIECETLFLVEST